MRELKKLLLCALVLVYLGGIGTGAWIGSLAAAPGTPHVDTDRRVQAFVNTFGLTESQTRQLRTIIAQHGKANRTIEQQINETQLRQKLVLEAETRDRIRNEVMDDSQRVEYDKLRARQ